MSDSVVRKLQNPTRRDQVIGHGYWLANWAKPKLTSPNVLTVLRTAHFACPILVVGYPAQLGDAPETVAFIDPELSTTIMK